MFDLMKETILGSFTAQGKIARAWKSVRDHAYGTDSIMVIDGHGNIKMKRHTRGPKLPVLPDTDGDLIDEQGMWDMIVDHLPRVFEFFEFDVVTHEGEFVRTALPMEACIAFCNATSTILDGGVCVVPHHNSR